MMFDFDKLLRAWKDTVTQRSEEYNKSRFRFHLFVNLYTLKERLETGTFRPSPLRFQTIWYPKVRIVQIPSIIDKIVQHLICDNYLCDALERPLIKETSACIKNRGDDYASHIVKEHLRTYYSQHQTNRFYVLKCDIKSFFASVPHDQMFRMLDRYVDDVQVLTLVKSFINLMPDGVGMALGLQQSHICGNLYLSDLDHYCKEKLKAKMYARHMDDFYIISDDLEYLKDCLGKIKAFVERKGLTLNPKTKITANHLDYLGFRYHLTKSGKIVKTLIGDKKKSKRRHINKLVNELKEGKITVQKLLDSYNGWRVHAHRGDCYALVKAWDQRVVSALADLDYKIIITKKGLIYHERNSYKQHRPQQSDQSCEKRY